MDYLQYVNLLIGTNSVKSYSNGNVSPLAAMPFGMNSFTIETRPDSDFLFFNPQDHTTTGIRLTHQLSPWLNDYGVITILPTDGDLVDFTPLRASGFCIDKTVLEPNLIGLKLLRYQTEISLTPTMRGAAVKLKYNNHTAAKRLFLDFWQGKSEVSIDAEQGIISGFTSNNRLDTAIPKNFKEYFVFKFNRAVDLDRTLATVNGEQLSGRAFYGGDGLKLSLCFAEGEESVELSFATSYLSLRQAEVNLRGEIGDHSFGDIYREGRRVWNEKLSKIEIESESREQLQTFYSCMWRAYLFPHSFYELDEEGRAVHYSPASGDICDGTMYTDMGFWDVYRTSFPLLTILEPELYGDICMGLTRFYKESGWLPRFSCPGPISCMPGTAIDMVFADAVKKGIIDDPDSIALMLEGMLRHATERCEIPRLGGRDGILDYNRLGYVPIGYRECVNKTLDYSYGDYCISLLADRLGDGELSQQFKIRALNYKNLFDKDSGFMIARDADGNPKPDFRQFEWSFEYTEGSAWQNSFSVFHDMEGHAALMGGREEMLAMIDRLFEAPPIFECGYRGKEIHEMTEMASVDFGQCALSNQPSFHIPYIYSYMGCPDKTCYQVRRAVSQLFNSSVNGYPGDEDTGSMSAWYLFSTLGLYPFTPGTGEYILASPSVKGAVVHTGYGTDFKISTEGFSDEGIYAAEVLWNGEGLKRTYLTHQGIARGGELHFRLSEEATGIKYSELPFSLSKNS